MGILLNGKLIKEIREEEMRMTQEELIGRSEMKEETSISIRSLRKAESDIPVGADVYVRLARLLRVEPADHLRAEKKLTLAQLRRLNEEAPAASVFVKK
jgi:hypothetical protein